MTPSSPRDPATRLDRFFRPVLDLAEMIRGKRLRGEDVPVLPLARHLHRYIQLHPRVDLNDVGEFAAAASQLLLLKSRDLAPPMATQQYELESPVGPSFSRDGLASFQPAVQVLRVRLDNSIESFCRNDYVAAHPRRIEIRPIAPQALVLSLHRQLSEMERRGLRRVPDPIFLRVEIAMRSLKRSLRQLRSLSFINLVRETGLDRRATVVYFLAILDLARRRDVDIRQRAPFADIEVVRRGGRDDRSGRTTEAEAG